MHVDASQLRWRRAVTSVAIPTNFMRLSQVFLRLGNVRNLQCDKDVDVERKMK